jgi:guanylate kinase
MDEWMRRINSRGKMQADELKRRLKSAEYELEYAVDSDSFIFVINDQLADAVENIDHLMRERKADMIAQEVGKKLAISLNQSVKKLLSTLD